MTRIGWIVSLITIVSMTGLTLWAAQSLPADQIPVHWNAEGVADDFVSRDRALLMLWLFTGLAAAMALLFVALPVIEPMRENLRKSIKLYGTVWISTMLLLLGVHAGITFMMVRGAGEAPDAVSAIPFARFVLAAVSILMILIGNYLPKTRQNFFLGIRTPWTLSSEYAWEKTHRLGGKLFIAAGLVSLANSFILDGTWSALGVTIPILTAALVSAVYSFFVWRKAPDKRQTPDYVV